MTQADRNDANAVSRHIIKVNSATNITGEEAAARPTDEEDEVTDEVPQHAVGGAHTKTTAAPLAATGPIAATGAASAAVGASSVSRGSEAPFITMPTNMLLLFSAWLSPSDLGFLLASASSLVTATERVAAWVIRERYRISAEQLAEKQAFLQVCALRILHYTERQEQERVAHERQEQERDAHIFAPRILRRSSKRRMRERRRLMLLNQLSSAPSPRAQYFGDHRMDYGFFA